MQRFDEMVIKLAADYRANLSHFLCLRGPVQSGHYEFPKRARNAQGNEFLVAFRHLPECGITKRFQNRPCQFLNEQRDSFGPFCYM